MIEEDEVEMERVRKDKEENERLKKEFFADTPFVGNDAKTPTSLEEQRKEAKHKQWLSNRLKKKNRLAVRRKNHEEIGEVVAADHELRLRKTEETPRNRDIEEYFEKLIPPPSSHQRLKEKRIPGDDVR